MTDIAVATGILLKGTFIVTLKALFLIFTAIAGIPVLIYILMKFRIFSFIQENYPKSDFFQKAITVKNKYVSFILQLSLNLTIDQMNTEDNDETIVGRVYLLDEAAKALGSEYQSQNLWDKPHWIPFIMDSFNENRG